MRGEILAASCSSRAVVQELPLRVRVSPSRTIRSGHAHAHRGAVTSSATTIPTSGEGIVAGQQEGRTAEAVAMRPITGERPLDQVANGEGVTCGTPGSASRRKLRSSSFFAGYSVCVRGRYRQDRTCSRSEDSRVGAECGCPHIPLVVLSL